MNISRKPTRIDLKIEISENDGLRSSGIDEMDFFEFKLSTKLRLKQKMLDRLDGKKECCGLTICSPSVDALSMVGLRFKSSRMFSAAVTAFAWSGALHKASSITLVNISITLTLMQLTLHFVQQR